MPIEDSERLEDEERWIEEHGPIRGGLPPELNAAMLDVHAGDDDER